LPSRPKHAANEPRRTSSTPQLLVNLRPLDERNEMKTITRSTLAALLTGTFVVASGGVAVEAADTSPNEAF
jgi:hypothetical protein